MGTSKRKGCVCRARYVRMCLPRWKVGECTSPCCFALRWRLRVLCDGVGGGGGGASAPVPAAAPGGAPALAAERWWRFLRTVPPSRRLRPRAVALWAEFPMPLSCFSRVSCSGRASCFRMASCICKASFCSLPHCPGAVGRGLPAARCTLPHPIGAACSGTPSECRHMTQGQWAVGSGTSAVHWCIPWTQRAVELLLCAASLAGTLGNGTRAVHCLTTPVHERRGASLKCWPVCMSAMGPH